MGVAMCVSLVFKMISTMTAQDILFCRINKLKYIDENRN